MLSVPINSLGQKKGNSKIILDTVSIDKIILTLFENNYFIDTKDEKLKFLSTKTKDIGSIGVRLRIIQKDSIVVLSGEVSDRALMIVLQSNESIYSPIKYGGMKGSTRHESWNEMKKVASSLGRILRYE